MTDPYLQPPVAPHRHVMSRTVIAALVVIVLMLIAVGFGFVRQNQRLDRSQSATTSLQASQQTATASTSKQLAAARAQIAALAAQLTSAQNRLKADEAQLRITAAQLPPDVVKLAAAVSPSVVLVGCSDELGTGFALDLPTTAGYQSVIVTAEHVVDGCVGTTVTAAVSVTHDGVNLPAHLRSADRDDDVAVIDVKGVVPALQAAPAPPASGQFVLAVGNPLGITDNVTQGNVSQVDATYFLNTAPISNGNSGGPLVDSSGRVLGIADAAQTADDDQPVVEKPQLRPAPQHPVRHPPQRKHLQLAALRQSG